MDQHHVPQPLALKHTSQLFPKADPYCLTLQATGKNFIMDSRFNLGNLLELGLHNYVDACSEIVDRAQKELIIEKALKKIDETWSALSLTFSPYQDTDNIQMTVEDTITEALETDNLALQTMSGGKYVQVNSLVQSYRGATIEYSSSKTETTDSCLLPGSGSFTLSVKSTSKSTPTCHETNCDGVAEVALGHACCLQTWLTLLANCANA